MLTPRLSRRTFLAATTAATLFPALPAQPGPAALHWPENGTLIPDEGWHLWVDREAAWKDDALFLPEDVDLARLPANPPTGGWQVLDHAPGALPVTLPGTVEQHLWGKFGSRPYTPDEYRYAADDPVPQNGAYFGVSWWYRKIDIDKSLAGKRLFLHVRGAHLRAEVYLNQKLVGYSIMEELPFECDLTAAARPGGENQLAIRITNPFGRYDWVDGLNAQWGAVKLFRSHGFGGLDRGLTISADQSVRISDLWVLNKPEPKSVEVNFTVSAGRATFAADSTAKVVDPTSGKVLGEVASMFGGGAGPMCYDAMPVNGKPTPQGKCFDASSSSSTQSVTLLCPSAQLWDLSNPKLYHLVVTIRDANGHTDTRTIPFGFRSFTVEGLGPASSKPDALFRLNGRRLKIYTSISWGYWGLNGIFPTPELAEKEVLQAKRLNLNCLNFHRNLAKEDVLRAHDRLGLLRYLEPGGGKMAIGKLPASAAANAPSIVMEKATDSADKFAQRYMFVKCVEMVKAFRSHPSVIEYCLQNEIGADLNNPDTLAILAAMRAEDPSRSIVLNDGFVAPPRKAAQAWYEPWNSKLHRSDGEEYGGWWNQHQGAGDQWYDEFYKSPREFTYAAPPLPGILTEYGEMEGCATPDNHSLMLHQQADPAGTGLGHQPANRSYDHADHAEILAAYDKFIDRWGFRKAFPSTEQLWLSLGKKCYDTWANYLENARISSDLDFCAISGWESTSIENHSGIVDNQRNFKSDPRPIADTLLPVRPVAKQRALCTERGQPAIFDLFLLNDTSKPVTGTLEFTAVTPSNKLLKLGGFPVPAQQPPDTFSHLIKEAFQTPPLTEEGMYRFRLALSSIAANTQTKEIWVSGVQEIDCNVNRNVGVAGLPPALHKQLVELGKIQCWNVSRFSPGKRYDIIISAGLSTGANATQNAGDITGLEAQPTAAGTAASTARLGHLDPAILDAIRAGTPLLAIPQVDTLAEGVAKQLAAAGAFAYSGQVGDYRAPWMGSWYFVREHPVYAGLPVNQAMGIHYGAHAKEANGLLVDGPAVEIIAAYSRDHDRRIGAGTFTTRLGKGKILFHRVPPLHPVLQQRFLSNAVTWLTTSG